MGRRPAYLAVGPPGETIGRDGRGDILAVSSRLVTFYVLRAGQSLYLIDTGFLAGKQLLTQALRRCGWEKLPIAGIILTHGHLDHIFNAASLAADSGAWIAAPRLDESHCAGQHPYRKTSRVCGMMEAMGRMLLGWRPFAVDRWYDNGAGFPECGLTAIHLPGHTAGHMGLLHSEKSLLFSADLFASSRFGAHLPPAIFNSEPGKIPASIAKAQALPITGLLPAHGSPASPCEHLARLRALRV